MHSKPDNAIPSESAPSGTSGRIAGISAITTQNAIHSTSAAEPVGTYAHARRAGGLLFLAGIGPRQRGSKTIPGVSLDASGKVADYDVAAQMHSCFENVRMILEQSGSSWTRIIDVTVFLTDMQRDFPTVNSLWATYFSDPATQPCRTTIEIKSLPQAGNSPINFEVKIIATVGE